MIFGFMEIYTFARRVLHLSAVHLVVYAFIHNTDSYICECVVLIYFFQLFNFSTFQRLAMHGMLSDNLNCVFS